MKDKKQKSLSQEHKTKIGLALTQKKRFKDPKERKRLLLTHIGKKE